MFACGDSLTVSDSQFNLLADQKANFIFLKLAQCGCNQQSIDHMWPILTAGESLALGA